MKKGLFVFCALLLAFPGQVSATDCFSTALNESDLRQCATGALTEATQQMEDTYRELMKKISQPGRDKLRETRIAWQAYREAQCAFDGFGHEEGSLRDAIVLMCQEVLTREFTGHLGVQRDCLDSDPSCGGQ